MSSSAALPAPVPDRARAPGSVTILAVAIGLGFMAGALRDPFQPLAIAVCVALFLFAAFSPPEQALAALIVSTLPGVLGRVQIAAVGIKPVELRAEEAAVMGLLLGHGLRLGRQAWREPLGKRWLLFTLVAAGSLVLSLRLWSGGEIVAGSLYLFRWAGFGAVLFLAIDVARRGRENCERMLSWLISAGIALSALGFLQFVFLPDMRDLKEALPQVVILLTDPHIGRLISTVLDPNLLGAMLAPVMAIALARALAAGRGLAVERWVSVAIVGAAIVMTVSRGSLLAAGIGCALVLVLAAPRLLWALLVLVPVIAAAAPRLFQRFQDALWLPNGVPVDVLGLHIRPEPSAYARILGWLTCRDIIASHPILGVGFNNYGLALFRLHARGAELYGTDSSLLLILATCGVVGLAVYLVLMGRLVADAWTSFREGEASSRWMGAGILGAFAALLVASFFTNALIYPPVLIALWVMAGVSAALRRVAQSHPPLV